MTALEPTVALVALAALIAPHLVPLRRAAPPAAITVWLLALALRAVAAVGLATLALIGLADVGPVRALLDWCWHEVLPDVPHELGFAEHPVSHAVVGVPAVALAASLLWLAFRLARTGLALRRKLASAIGPGPLGSTVVADDRVVVAVASVGRGRLIVSDRALGELDQGELAAGLVHELAHLRRRHRPLLLLAALLAALGRPLPGTRAAERELRFHIERDADQATVRELHDPLSLASAICKVAGAPGAGMAGLGGRGRVTQRLEELLDGPVPGRDRSGRAAWALAAGLLAVLVTLGLTAPAWSLGTGERAATEEHHACSHTS
jgi:Zn-dependent protease with chaperone function